jgi:hypothetical protein
MHVYDIFPHMPICNSSFVSAVKRKAKQKFHMASMSLHLPCTKESYMCYFSLYKRYLPLDERSVVNIKLRGKYVEGFKKSKRNMGAYLESGWVIEPWNSQLRYKIADCTIATSSVTVSIWWNWEKSDQAQSGIRFALHLALEFRRFC